MLMKIINWELNNIQILVKVYKRSKKNIILKFRGNIIELSIPKKSSYKLATSILKDKEEWIKSKYFKEESDFNKKEFYFLGKKYLLENKEEIQLISLQGEKFFFENKLQIKEFIFKEVRKIIFNKLELYSQKINVTHGKIRIKYLKSAWGICYSNKNLSFNLLLCSLPENLIEYVIIHELCHLKHLNHSKEFWNLVEKYCPNYKSLRKDLKDLSSNYTLINTISFLEAH